jgi:hypothetical protein
MENAEGGFGDFLGMHPNGAYDTLGSYVDPALPWPGAATHDSHALALARHFHRAHAKDWCDRFRAGDAELDLDKLRDQARKYYRRSARHDVHALREFVERQLRIGDEATYDSGLSQEPLCALKRGRSRLRATRLSIGPDRRGQPPRPGPQVLRLRPDGRGGPEVGDARSGRHRAVRGHGDRRREAGQSSISGTYSGGRFRGFVFFPLLTSATITDFGLDPGSKCAGFSTITTNVGLHSDGPAFPGTPALQDGIVTATVQRHQCTPRSFPNGHCVLTGLLVPGR